MSRWIADGTQIFKCFLSFRISIKFSQLFIANMISADYNSQILQANLQVVLSLYMQRIEVIILFISESIIN
jgi:hypothetical protein